MVAVVQTARTDANFNYNPNTNTLAAVTLNSTTVNATDVNVSGTLDNGTNEITVGTHSANGKCPRTKILRRR